jgi:hypothetical protein
MQGTAVFIICGLQLTFTWLLDVASLATHRNLASATSKSPVCISFYRRLYLRIQRYSWIKGGGIDSL